MMDLCFCQEVSQSCDVSKAGGKKRGHDSPLGKRGFEYNAHIIFSQFHCNVKEGKWCIVRYEVLWATSDTIPKCDEPMFTSQLHICKSLLHLPYFATCSVIGIFERGRKWFCLFSSQTKERLTTYYFCFLCLFNLIV